MRVVALAGGTGSAKLLRGLSDELGQFTVIANPGDNVWMYGLYICPDIDIAMYTLAGIANRKKGWGIEGDTFAALRQLKAFGEQTWFELGDMDMATCLFRTELLKRGETLTQVTKRLCRWLGVRQDVIPPTDNHVETHIITRQGEMHLQEYWVKRRGRPKSLGVKYLGANTAKVTREARDAILGADKIIICPGNPITSILPILAVGDFRRVLKNSNAYRVALSPMFGRGAFGGPAPALMRASEFEPTSLGVAKLYSDVIDEVVVHDRDGGMKGRIEALGMRCRETNTLMRNRGEERRVASILIEKK